MKRYYLFCLYINDVEQYLKNCHVNNSVGITVEYLKILILFVDDACLISSSIDGLNYGLKYFSSYCKLWHLKLNAGKTKVVIFG